MLDKFQGKYSNRNSRHSTELCKCASCWQTRCCDVRKLLRRFDYAECLPTTEGEHSNMHMPAWELGEDLN